MGPISRPLLILFVVIVVLGVISCGGAALKGPSDHSKASWDFAPGAIPIDEIRSPGDSCTVDPERNVITVASSCTFSIDAQAFPPRELRVRVVAGTPLVTIVQKVRDYERAEATTFGPLETFAVSAAAGEGKIQIAVSCTPLFPPSSCAIEILAD